VNDVDSTDEYLHVPLNATLGVILLNENLHNNKLSAYILNTVNLWKHERNCKCGFVFFFLGQYTHIAVEKIHNV